MSDTFQSVHAATPAGQDRACVSRHGSRLILAVADGAGGRSGGAEAAEMAIRLIQKRASDLFCSADCRSLLMETDLALSRDAIAGETTCVVAVVSPSGIAGASVGDSGAQLASPFGISELTQDQNRKPFLGAGAAMPTCFEVPKFSGTLLLATDGLIKYTSRERIEEALQDRDLKQVGKLLVDLVRYSSGALPDDVAIVLCRSSS
jgi:serine/threonine protein phosphatase PrpC